MNNLFKYLAQFISNIFHPIIIPFYGFLILMNESVLQILPEIYKRYILLIILVFTTVIPVIFIFLLKKMKVISSVTLRERKERHLPDRKSVV